jgi:beta-lactamase class A
MPATFLSAVRHCPGPADRYPPGVAALLDLVPALDAVDGTVSVQCGLPGRTPGFSRLADVPHYAASTMKVAVLAAAYRSADRQELDLDEPVAVHNAFGSAAAGRPVFGCDPDDDSDPQVWRRLGGQAPIRWLLHRMIVRSSNLATNLVLERIGIAAADQAWRLAGATTSRVCRGIEDAAAAAAGLTNLVTAADLCALFGTIALGAEQAGPLASPAACAQMLAVLRAQEHLGDLATGLPPGTPVALKGGWIRGVRHGAGLIGPPDAPPYLLAVCTTTPLAVDDAGDAACRLLARIAAASWADRLGAQAGGSSRRSANASNVD